MPTNSSSSSNPLPAKENALFKRIVKCYEQKQYKNGLKFSKQILSNAKYADHGETLAMKGLILNCLGRKEEAYDHVRRGLRNDLKSHVCWHVYGLLQRSEKKYFDAIKSYRNALKWDKDNIQILRDLSLLQIQMRDLEGYKETRYQLFQLRPTQRASWIGFAMSYHLVEDHDMALKILEEFRKTQQKAAYDYEHSELLLYQNMVISESGDKAGALEHLEKYKDSICDKAQMMFTKGEILMSTGKKEEARAIFEDLVERNPENHDYYRKLEESSDCKTPEEQLAIYEKYIKKFPRAQAPKRLPLTAIPGDHSAFKELLEPYLKKALRKGVPPLFVDMKPLYADKTKAKVIEEVLQKYLTNLKTEKSSFEGDDERESPTVLLWLLYYWAQHLDFFGKHEEALAVVEEAIEHTPTLIELYLLKGKIFKHLGNPEEAVRWLDEAQSMDTADRYINCKCAKYMLRAGRTKEAEEMCAKFIFSTKENLSASDNLNEMQCMWYQTEAANAFQSIGKWGEALKKCIEVDRHFSEIIEDQFDFHTYCMRKMTLRSYVDLLRLEDTLRAHRFYEKIAHCAIQVYLRLHEKPVTDDDSLADAETAGMDPAELKKLRNKQKKAKLKAEREKQEAQKQQAKKDMHNKAQNRKTAEDDGADDGAGTGGKNEDLKPEKLERPEDPLGEAVKFLEPLLGFAANRPSTHLLAFEVYFRKKRPLLMLKAIKAALKCEKEMAKVAAEGKKKGRRPEDLRPEVFEPKLHGCVVRFRRFVEDNLEVMNDSVKKVIERETKNLPNFDGITATKANETFLKKNKENYGYVIEGALQAVTMEPRSVDTHLQTLGDLERFKAGVDITNCSRLLRCLEDGGFGSKGRAAAESFRSKFAARFPRALTFNPSLAKALEDLSINSSEKPQQSNNNKKS